jgi:hypothetical protein
MFQENSRCKKFKNVILAPFQIVWVGSNSWYCKLHFPVSWTIQSVINIGLLERYKEEDCNNQGIWPDADCNDWLTESIIASRHFDDNVKQYLFIVKWKDFLREENKL